MKIKHLIISLSCVAALSLQACGPSLCDCADSMKGAAGQAIDNLLQGEKPELEAAKKKFTACKEKYGHLSPSELAEEWKSCNK